MQSDGKQPWWSEEYDFFGSFYMQGDNSQEGYLINHKQTLSERTATEVDGMQNLLKLSPGASVLDLPCGYGRHSIELAARGYQITGLDINSTHLSRAREEARKRGIEAKFDKGNMLDFNVSEQFDAAINMFYSFGFFETDEENKQAAQNFYDCLKAGGKFLMHTDVNVPRILSGKYKEDEERHLSEGKTLRIIDKYNPETKRIDGAWIIKDDQGKEERKEYSVRVYTKEEFIELCKAVGFSHCEAYSDWQGTPYSEEAEDMIVVATK